MTPWKVVNRKIMLKTDLKVFKAVVDNNGERAVLVCVTYRIGSLSPHYGAEFYELITSFDNSPLKIPLGAHTFTLQEELRLFSNAVAIAPENGKEIEAWIETKMQEVYGKEAKVFVSDFPAKNEN